MASANDIIATTLRNRSGMWGDMVSENTALMSKLRSKGKLKTYDGGYEIVQELKLTQNGTAQWYSGYDQFDVRPQQVLDYAHFDPKQVGASVTISGEEMLANSGREKKLSLLDARIDVAETSLKNIMSEGMYSDGTGNNGKQIGGLAYIVSISPNTGVVGGIDRSSVEQWRNKAATGQNISNIMTVLNTMYTRLRRGSDHVDLIPMADEPYNALWQALQDKQRFMDSTDKAMAGFGGFRFNKADVVLDGGYGGDAPANYAYLLNCDTIFLRSHKDRNLVSLGVRQPVDQDASIHLISWSGNATTNNPSLNGVIRFS